MLRLGLRSTRSVRARVSPSALSAVSSVRRIHGSSSVTPTATATAPTAKSIFPNAPQSASRLWRRPSIVANASPASVALASRSLSTGQKQSQSAMNEPVGNAWTYATGDKPLGMTHVPKGSPTSDFTLSRLPHISSESLSRYPHTKLTTLPNGIRVATERGFGETATVGVWVDTGSRYESAETNGVAHFLEHLFFKGTARRTQQQLEVEVENIGGHLNAYTSREQTVFYAKVFKQDVPQAMDILGDILLNSQFTEEAVERERAVILKEHEEVNNSMEEVIFDRLHETSFRGTSLARPILGSVENINSIKREDIIDYVKTHYTAPRMVICGAGAIDHDQLVALATKIFSNVPRDPPNGKKVVFEPAKFTGSDLRIRYDTMDHAHIAFAFPTAGWTDPDAFPLMVIQTLMGAWDKSATGGKHSSSYMIEQIASNHIAHHVQTFNTQYSDIGLFGVYATCDAVGQNDLMYVLTQQTTRLCIQLEEFQLQEAKNQLKMNMLAALDGSTVVCEDIGRQMLTYGRRMHPAEVMARIDAVDLQAVKACANRYFYDRDHSLAAIGPIWELPHYMWIRRRTYSMRY